MGKRTEDQLRKHDNHGVIEILTTMASCLAEARVFSEKETNDFRASVINIQRSANWTNSSALVMLKQQNCNLLDQLSERYGELGLHKIVFRKSIQAPIRQMIATVATMGLDLLGKSRIFFNKPFYIFLNNECDQRVLFSQVLVDVAEALGQINSQLSEILKKLQVMELSTCYVATDDGIDLDEKMAVRLEYLKVEKDVLPHRREMNIHRELISSMSAFCESLVEFAYQMDCNYKTDLTPLSVHCQLLAAETAKLAALDLSLSKSIFTRETTRFQIVAALAEINDILENILNSYPQYLSLTMTQQHASHVPHSVRRSISSDLINGGVEPRAAIAAADSLITYCRSHDINPSQLLEAELAKISPMLRSSSLTLLKQGTAQDQPSLSQTKDVLLNKSAILSSLFNKMVTSLGSAVLVGLFFLQGCGLKTAPRSNVDDFRPEIPFRTGQNTTPTEKDKTP
ncbi:MAG: hypothetical protein AB7T49_01905 [Oligoflexales bacterium]